jgi:hypothetical protein
MSDRANVKVVRAKVPLAEMFGILPPYVLCLKEELICYGIC